MLLEEMKLLAVISAFCICLYLVACGGSDDSSTAIESTATAAAKAEATNKPTPIRSPRSKPVLVPPKGPPPKQLVIKDLSVGKGPIVGVGDKVTAEYTGYNYSSHEEFTNRAHTWGKGEPLIFEFEGGELIPGVEQGVEGMRVGGRRELIIPPHLAYNTDSPPPAVGKNATVIYFIELLGIG